MYHGDKTEFVALAKNQQVQNNIRKNIIKILSNDLNEMDKRSLLYSWTQDTHKLYHRHNV